jgi:hypothetical protein
MRPATSRSLLVLVTSAIAACGSTGTVSQNLDASADAPADAAKADASTDAVAEGAADAATDACPIGTAPDGDGGCISLTVRRPFLIGASMRSATTIARSDWELEISPEPALLDDRTRTMLAEAWLRDALEEHASIAAFARLTMQLLSLGAPPAMVLASQRAGIDEIQHARACFALAKRYGGASAGPAPLVVSDALGATTLADIARIAAEEGCVGETLGAALAAAQLERTTDATARCVVAKIARDEARHAELAWGFAAWAIRVGGPAIAGVFAEAITRAAQATIDAPVRSYDGVDLDRWHAHGRVTCAEAREIARRAVRDVVRPALALLSPDELGGRAPSRLVASS